MAFFIYILTKFDVIILLCEIHRNGERLYFRNCSIVDKPAVLTSNRHRKNLYVHVGQLTDTETFTLVALRNRGSTISWHSDYACPNSRPCWTWLGGRRNPFTRPGKSLYPRRSAPGEPGPINVSDVAKCWHTNTCYRIRLEFRHVAACLFELFRISDSSEWVTDGRLRYARVAKFAIVRQQISHLLRSESVTCRPLSAGTRY